MLLFIDPQLHQAVPQGKISGGCEYLSAELLKEIQSPGHFPRLALQQPKQILETGALPHFRQLIVVPLPAPPSL
jgi:hypothetical protein